MLSRLVCEKCIKTYLVKFRSNGDFWWLSDTANIGNGCFLIGEHRNWKYNKPPERCPYLLEHLMETQNVE